MMRWAAVAMVCRPEEQKRLMVMPEVVTGRPARSAFWRAMLAPVAPSGLAQPMITSSTEAGSMPARCTACCTAWPPSVAPWVMLKAPFQLLASGVRAVETMTALVMVCSLSNGVGSVGPLPRLQAARQRMLVAERASGEALAFGHQLLDQRRGLPELGI